MSLSLDVPRSQALAEQIKAKSKEPYANAARAASKTPGARYVQGFLALNRKPFEPIEHAWIEVEEAILDPNFDFLKVKPENLLYFPAHRITAKQLKAALDEAKEDYPDDDPLPIYGPMPYEYYGDKMLGGKDYQAAFKAAEHQCLEFRGEN
jgi:hypothetical protein